MPYPGVLPTICRLLEIDVGIAQRSASDHVSAHSDGEDGTGGAELLVEHGLGHVRVQVPHIEGGHRVTGRAGIHVQRHVFSVSAPKPT